MRGLGLGSALLLSTQLAWARQDVPQPRSSPVVTGDAVPVSEEEAALLSGQEMELNSGASLDPESLPIPESRDGRERWYWSLGFGAALNRYPAALQAEIDTVSAISGVARLPIQIELSGITFPSSFKSGLLAGGSVIWATDRFSKGSAYTALSTLTVAGSVMQFFSARPGDGMYLRVDAGFTRLTTSASNGYSAQTDWGPSGFLGGGYGMPFSNEARLLLQGGGYVRVISQDVYFGAAVGMGLLL